LGARFLSLTVNPEIITGQKKPFVQAVEDNVHMEELQGTSMSGSPS
jgi:hypothetical protein